MSQSNTTTMKVKVILGQDIRRWRYSKESKFSSLKEFVASSFNLKEFWLQYEDDEGDRLTLSSENDFEDSFACAQQQDRKSLKIYVIQGSIHNAQHSTNTNTSSAAEPEPQQSVPSCHEIKQAATDFLQNPAIAKLLPDLYRRIFEDIKQRKANQESTEYKASESSIPTWDSPQSVEQIMRNILSNETKFAPITSHELYQKKLSTMLPHLAAKIAHHLPILMSLSPDAIASWIPHLAAVIGGGLNNFVSSNDTMFSFFPLMCSFMRQHGDYSCGFDADEDGKVIHFGVQCDECNMSPITGARFKCMVCSNYDLCAQCESLSKHDTNHPLIKFTLNARNAVPPFMGLHEIITQFGHGPHHWFGHLWKPQNGGRRRPQNNGFQPHEAPPHHAPHYGPPHHPHHAAAPSPHNAWWNPHRGWGKRCNRGYQNQAQYNSFDGAHNVHNNPWNEWCGNRQNEAQAHAESHENVKPMKVKVMADFVCDVTLQDRTYYPTDTVLTKTWKMKNNGEHAWGDHVELVFFKGNESLTLEKRYPVMNAKPGQEVEVSAVIKTPKKDGRYCSYYRLQRNGEYFGPRVWVDIFAVNEDYNNNNNNKWKHKHKNNNKNKSHNNNKKQMKVEKKSKKEASKVEKEKEIVEVDEEQLLDDIVNAAVKELEETLSKIACVCGTTLDKTSPMEAYKGAPSAKVNCDICGKFAAPNASIYHCPNEKAMAHPEGYDVCCNCAEYQLQRFIAPVDDVPNVVVPPPNVVEAPVVAQFVYNEQLEQLRAIGFNDDEKLKKELLKEKGNVQRVANRLLQQ